MKQGLRTSDFDSELWSVIWSCRHILDFAQREHTIDHLPKHNVFAVQEVTFRGCDEELRV